MSYLHCDDNALHHHPAATVSLTQCRYHVQLVLLEAKRMKGRSCGQYRELIHYITLINHAKGCYVRIRWQRWLTHCDTCDSAL
jgi:hypothetical protein